MERLFQGIYRILTSYDLWFKNLIAFVLFIFFDVL